LEQDLLASFSRDDARDVGPICGVDCHFDLGGAQADEVALIG
jgi:hypothetical protein